VSSWLSTNVFLFQAIFGDAFIFWLEWMRLEDNCRFKEVLQNAVFSESQEHVRILTTNIVPSETTPFGFQMIHEQVSSCKIQEYFVDSPYFEHRVSMFLDWAAQCASRWYYTFIRHGKDIGWCPLSKLIYSEYYPFALPQLVRSSILQDWTRAFKMNKSMMLKMNSFSTFEWFRALLPEICDPNLELIGSVMGVFYGGNESVPIANASFIPELLQKYVYHKDIETIKREKTSFIHFESICSRVVNKLIQLYLDTVFRQLFDSIGLTGKQQIWNLVESQILDFANS
jgi:hypothetical protein